MDFSLIKQLGTAVLLAALIGLERERSSQIFNHRFFAGIRTFSLIGLLGALAYILRDTSVYFFELISLGFLAMVVGSYIVTSIRGKEPGITTEVASVLVYLVGVLCATEDYLLATLVTLVVLVLLHFREVLHSWARRVSREEILSAIKFIIVAFVILPLLPNEGYGPFEFFNPYIVWLMVVFISGISFVSYITIRLFGEKRGTLFTGFLAGFVSSTALTLSFAHQSRGKKGSSLPYVIAILVASSAMFFRVLVEVSVVNRMLLPSVIVPMVLMGGTGLLCAVWLYFKYGQRDTEVTRQMSTLKSPFSLKPAMVFALFFTVIVFLVEAGKAYLGNSGVYITSVVSGVMDVDAITLTLARAAGERELASATAATGIVIAAAVNTLSKGVFFLLFGSRRGGALLLSVFAVLVALGFSSLLFS